MSCKPCACTWKTYACSSNHAVCNALHQDGLRVRTEAPAQVPMLSAGASVPTREQSIGRQTPPAYLCACAKAAHAQIDTVDKCRFAVIHRLLPLS